MMTGNLSTAVTAHKPTLADIEKRMGELLTQAGLHSQNLTCAASPDSPPANQQSSQGHKLEPDRPPLRRSGWRLDGQSRHQRAPYRTWPHRHSGAGAGSRSYSAASFFGTCVGDSSADRILAALLWTAIDGPSRELTQEEADEPEEFWEEPT